MVPRGERSSNAPDLLDNLQSWYENNYDTRLLHSNLAFPLLKKLTDIGDPLTKQVFKEEIAKRLIASVSKGFCSIIYYFYREGYISYLTRDEFWSVFGADGQILYEIEKLVRKYEIVDNKRVY